MKKMLLILVVTSFAIEARAQVAELSAIAAGIKTEDAEFNDDDMGSAFSMKAVGRYGQLLTDDTQWFADVGMVVRNYDAEGEFKAPDDSVGLLAGAGLRWFFIDFNTNLIPYLSGRGFFRTDRQGEIARGSATEVSKNGLYYAGTIGMRIPFNVDIFVDFELDLFESALFAIEKTKTSSGDKTETTRFQVFADMDAGLSDFKIALGMKI